MRLDIPTVQVESVQETLPTIIQGYPAGSKEEARIAVAADRQGREYLYQKQFFGGRNMRGGQVLDFLFLTMPKATPVFIQGEYWHRSEESRLKVMDFEQATRDKYNPPIEIPASIITSIQAAEAILTQVLGAP